MKTRTVSTVTTAINQGMLVVMVLHTVFRFTPYRPFADNLFWLQMFLAGLVLTGACFVSYRTRRLANAIARGDDATIQKFLEDEK